MTIEVRPTDAPCGAEICGVDATKPLDATAVDVIESAFRAHGVLLFRQQPLTARQLADFGAHFGSLQAHVQRKYQHADVPEIVQMTNRKADGSFDDIGAARGAAKRTRDAWHSDLSFDPCPAKATFLHAVEIPSSGGNTCFSNVTQAYEALPDATKQRLNGMRAEFRYGTTTRHKGNSLAAQALDANTAAAAVATHPVIVAHPETKEPGIFVNPFTTSHILDLPDAESDRLLDDLFDAMDKPEYRWEHVWSVGDTLMWDNRGGLMHAGRMDYPHNEARRFIRATVRGGPTSPYDLTHAT